MPSARVGDALATLQAKRGLTSMKPTRWFWIPLGPLSIPVPHPGQLHWHDVHHIALGYDNELIGEAEISAFELRTGTRTFMVTFLCLASTAIGLVLAPRRVFRAFARARGCRNCYGLERSEVLDWTVAELRAWMGLEPR